MSESDVGTPLNTGKSEAADRTELRGELARSLARGGMSGVQVISWETAQEVLTPKRREVVGVLGRMSPSSVRELSRELDRDKAQVSRDLAALAEHGIIRYEEDGRVKKPRLTQEHLVVEPVV